MNALAMPSIRYGRVESEQDLKGTYAVRQSVFVEEQVPNLLAL
jgi:hypothetical protein